MADSAPPSKFHKKLNDRLINLPEHILLHILSFLPTKTAVKTSVLSKPWQHLWTLVLAIDLYDHSGPYYQGMPCGKTFEDSLISKVLNGNKAPMRRRFRLTGLHCSTSQLDNLLSSATERNVEEIDLDFRKVFEDVLPYPSPSTFVFYCAPESYKTLVVMKVRVRINRRQFVIGGHLNFPTLKVLHLNTVEFDSSRFPLLEELELADLGDTFHHDIDISLPMLRRLYIECRCIQPVGAYTLNVEAPSLQYLVLSSLRSNGVFRVEDLPNLVEANVSVLKGSSINKSDDKYGESLINFLNVLCNAKVLNLCVSTMQDLFSRSLLFHAADRIQPFRNLVELDIPLVGSLLDITMIMLSKFVNLEHLKMTEYNNNRYDETEYCLKPPTHVPNCLTYHLKTFRLEDFSCSKHEMEFIIYILKNSLVVENVKIIFCPRLVWRKGYDSKKIISKSSRGSLECKLEFDQKVSEFEDIDSYSDYSE